MGRITRNSSNGSSRLPSGSSSRNDHGRKTLINSNGKRVRVKKTLDSKSIPGTESQVTSQAKFEFKTEVPFAYSPRQHGFGTVLEYMRSGDETVKDKILNECNLILECRVCNNLFRSPRDFVTHKDKHCREKYERISPAGLTQLLRLAQNSFKANESSNSSVSVLPPIVSTGDNVKDDHSLDLSFDMNHLVPMLNTVLYPTSPSKEKQSGVHFQPTEVQLAAHTNAGIVRTTRQLPRGVNGEVGIKGKYKSKKSDKAAIIGVDGKAALVGKPSSIQLIVDRLTAQWESKMEEESKISSLNCHVCQMSCPSEKALRIHIRQDHRHLKMKKPRKNAKTINGITAKEKTKTEVGQTQDVMKDSNTISSIQPVKPKKLLKSTNVGSDSKQNKVVLGSGSSSTKSTVIHNKTKASPRGSSFRRLTNNSFSATLALSPESAPIISSLQELQPKKSKLAKPKLSTRSCSPSSNATHSSEEVAPDYKAMVKALFVKSKKRRKKETVKTNLLEKRSRVSTPPKKLTCLKCSAEMETEIEMSIHLGNCHGSQNNINKIGIIDRHDYMTHTKTEPEDDCDGTMTTSPLPFFNNNENEVACPEIESHSTSAPMNSCPLIEIRTEVKPLLESQLETIDTDGNC